jgi:pimeloyl-ACP methyl ester carboxylesterase
MSSVSSKYGRISYTTEGEGFPLVLVPHRANGLTDWAQQIPLFGELCRVIAYEPASPQQCMSQSHDSSIAILTVVLDVLTVERAYLAGYAQGSMTALRAALQMPARVEALLLIGMDDAMQTLPLPELTVPTCIFVGANCASHRATAALVSMQVPRCATITIPGAGAMPHQEQPLPLGRAMMDFLIHCERQRNLVRGASLLL